MMKEALESKSNSMCVCISSISYSPCKCASFL